jgi:hypothetical protein
MTQAQPEPSMEEILASIRRIISDDGEEEAAPAPVSAQAAATGPRPRPTPVPSAQAPAASGGTQQASPSRPGFLKREDGTGRADEDRAQTHLKTEDIEMIKKSAALEADVVVDEVAAAAAAKAFQTLSQTVRITAKGEGRTLEDLVTEILRPLIKQWLDQNLAAIV